MLAAMTECATRCSAALMEWATVCAALAAGDEIVLVRKGGIHERGGQFAMKHDHFLLWPTYLHQAKERLEPALAERYWNAHASDPVPGQHRLTHWARVASVQWCEQRERLAALAHWLPWVQRMLISVGTTVISQACIFIALRVYALAEPVLLAHTAAFNGCRSWVDLPETLSVALSVAGATPVVDDATWLDRMQRLATLLGHE